MGHIGHRIAEHAGVSHLTGNEVKNKAHSSIRDHCSRCRGSNCSSQNFKIFAKGSNELELLIKERLLIQRRKPALNANKAPLICCSSKPINIVKVWDCAVFVCVYIYIFTVFQRLVLCFCLMMVFSVD